MLCALLHLKGIRISQNRIMFKLCKPYHRSVGSSIFAHSGSAYHRSVGSSIFTHSHIPLPLLHLSPLSLPSLSLCRSLFPPSLPPSLSLSLSSLPPSLPLSLSLSLSLSSSPKTSLRAGGTHLSVLARGLASYLHVSLDSKEVDRIGRVLSQQTTRWILDMMK